MYIVYSEFFENGVERWYYGTYDQSRANEVALNLNRGNIQYCVCSVDDAKSLNILNLPF